MTGPLSYFIAVLMAGFMLGILSLIVGIFTLDIALIGFALGALLIQTVTVVALLKWVDRNVGRSEKWLKDAVSARNDERGMRRRGTPQEYRTRGPLPADENGEQERAPAPRGLFYAGALLLLVSTFVIAFVWESPGLALIWLSGIITLYLIHRYFIRN